MRQTHLTIYHAKNKQIQSNRTQSSFIFPETQLFSNVLGPIAGWLSSDDLERLSAQQAYVIERDNDFAADNKLCQVVQLAQRPVFQNPSPEIHCRMQLPVASL